MVEIYKPHRLVGFRRPVSGSLDSIPWITRHCICLWDTKNGPHHAKLLVHQYSIFNIQFLLTNPLEIGFEPQQRRWNLLGKGRGREPAGEQSAVIGMLLEPFENLVRLGVVYLASPAIE